MKSHEDLFFKLIRSAALGSDEDFSSFSDFEDWGLLFALCNAHSLTGVIYDRTVELFRDRIPQKFAAWFKQSAFKAMSFQTVRSLTFINIYSSLLKSGITPVVLKGEMLRQLYPVPEGRTSLDEDLLIDGFEYEKLTENLTSMGFEEVNQGEEDKHWVNKQYSLYLEVHFNPFPNEKSYEKWNAAFEGCFDRTVRNQNGTVSLSREDALIFLFLHAAKHFVYSGVGVKQLLDIALYMKHYKKEIDFSYVRAALKKAKALTFAQEVTAFIKEYLYDGVYCFGSDRADPDFVKDVISGGSLGRADEERVNSANVTSSAFKGKSSLKKILFPPKERLYKKYPFSKKCPLLLPLAWLMRLIAYALHGKKKKALQTGNTRLRMIKELGLIDK